ncbi:hypothetical protein INT44_005878 [Umbelopsis vinacea]|uniref:Uncharacterized protein n=1 Tax=Umbelopsis vinacea TaxID=44442 RepID=A0A8H7PZ34_9FUNG|nr:hypothetical protein INT44_005878 [Umbelopsis vinacea]KAI9282956.1 hypothetical protein BC943DRAFT_327992 [Umbelopsis sp. AD052]
MSATEATNTAEVTPQDQAVEEPTAQVTADTGAAPATTNKKNEFFDKIKHSFDKIVRKSKPKAAAADAPVVEATSEPVNAATE